MNRFKTTSCGDQSRYC